ncbi:Receptor-like protein kinase FERONIA [Camellia lanceoleosa]|nr:Receptor-like protein kinase FERONIA [Camellia lanceoleosa]
MLTIALYLYSLLHHLSSTAATTLPYTPTDYFLLNCGSSSNATSQDGRSWDGDATSKFSPSNIGTTSSASTATKQDPSVTDIPFLTARIFTSKFTYTFPVSSGPKFIRLYFYPATYSNFDRSKSFFSVTAANYTFLTNFSAFLTVSVLVPQQYTLIKEFVVNVRDTQKLDITFNPSPNSYAFINGIEVVSIPNNFYMKGDLNRIHLIGSQQSFYIDNNTALETLYRLNVGGNDVSVNDDTGMYRAWHPDDPYIYGAAFGLVPHREVPIRYTNETPNYTAPATVYTTARTMGRDPNINLNYNLTWIFTVDSGFWYLARLHFCEFQPEVTRVNERIFSVYMNNQTADQAVDVILLSGGNGIPVFKDYVLSVPAVDGLRSKVDLWLAMHPNIDSKPTYADAILNGLEIFKLNQSDGSLAGSNPEYDMVPAPPAPYPKLSGKQNSKTSLSLVFTIAGGVISGVFLI